MDTLTCAVLRMMASRCGYKLSSSHYVVANLPFVVLVVTCLRSTPGDCATLQIFPSTSTSITWTEQGVLLPLPGITLCRKMCPTKYEGCLLACALYKPLQTNSGDEIPEHVNKTLADISVPAVGFNHQTPLPADSSSSKAFDSESRHFNYELTQEYSGTWMESNQQQLQTTASEVKTSPELPDAQKRTIGTLIKDEDMAKGLINEPVKEIISLKQVTQVSGVRSMNVNNLNSAAAAEDENKLNTVPLPFKVEAMTTVAHDEARPKVGIVEDTKLEPFQLRLVSLSLENSLVVAEIVWNKVGGNVEQDYLVTWELAGGGLAGNLVTDSTSTTLNLWQDTSYQIQVELFQGTLDFDEEQPIPAVSSNFLPVLKSSPLFVDTTGVGTSVPLKVPSSLVSDYAHNDGSRTIQHDILSNTDKPSSIFSNGFTTIIFVIFLSFFIVIVICILAILTWSKLIIRYSSQFSQKRAALGYADNNRSKNNSYISGAFSSPNFVAQSTFQVSPLNSDISGQPSLYIAPLHFEVLSCRNNSQNKTRVLWDGLIAKLSQTENQLLLDVQGQQKVGRVEGY